MPNIPEGTGAIRYYTAAGPVSGGPSHIAPPPHTRWHVLAAAIGIACDATVATRYVYAYARIQGVHMFNAYDPVGIIASQSRDTFWSIGAAPMSTILGQDITVPLPHHIFLTPLDDFTFDALNIQAGDTLNTGRIVVEEWIEP